MIAQYFSDLVSGLESSIQENPEGASPRKRFALEVARLGQRLYSGDGRTAWCGVTVPFDLLNAMGITSCFVEFIGAILASTGGIVPMLEEAEKTGYAPDTCGFHRAVIGAAQQGLMPVPDFLIGTTCPCSGGLAVIENLARYFNRDLFVLHIPQDNSRANVTYLADQLRRLVRFIEDHTGETLDKERLTRAMELTNQARETMVEALKLTRHVPSPASSKELKNFAIVMALFMGTESAVEITEAYKKAFAARIAAGKSGVPGERLRLMWVQNRIQLKHPLVQILEQEYQACIVVDELNDITWEPVDPRDPYESLARRAISIPLNGSFEYRISHLQKLARGYQIDGAINPCHWGCRQGTGARGLVEEGLKKIGVPVLNLEVDCVDPRNFSEGQLRTRLEAFIEMLSA